MPTMNDNSTEALETVLEQINYDSTLRELELEDDELEDLSNKVFEFIEEKQSRGGAKNIKDKKREVSQFFRRHQLTPAQIAERQRAHDKATEEAEKEIIRKNITALDLFFTERNYDTSAIEMVDQYVQDLLKQKEAYQNDNGNRMPAGLKRAMIECNRFLGQDEEAIKNIVINYITTKQQEKEHPERAPQNVSTPKATLQRQSAIHTRQNPGLYNPRTNPGGAASADEPLSNPAPTPSAPLRKHSNGRRMQRPEGILDEEEDTALAKAIQLSLIELERLKKQPHSTDTDLDLQEDLELIKALEQSELDQGPKSFNFISQDSVTKLFKYLNTMIPTITGQNINDFIKHTIKQIQQGRYGARTDIDYDQELDNAILEAELRDYLS